MDEQSWKQPQRSPGPLSRLLNEDTEAQRRPRFFHLKRIPVGGRLALYTVSAPESWSLGYDGTGPRTICTCLWPDFCLTLALALAWGAKLLSKK